MNGKPFQSRTRPRRGLTLVELLVVVSVIVVLIGVAIPLARTALRGQQVREATRQLNSMVLLAKSQAAAKGQPVALWIERDRPGSNQAVTVYLAEPPLPYTGDLQGATALMLDTELRAHDPPPLPFYGVGRDPGGDRVWGTSNGGSNSDGDDDDNGFVNDLAEAGWPGSNDSGDGRADTALFGPSAASLPFLARVGDFIQFDNKGYLYTITRIHAEQASGVYSSLPSTATYIGSNNNYLNGVYPVAVEFRHPDARWNAGPDGQFGHAGSNDPFLEGDVHPRGSPPNSITDRVGPWPAPPDITEGGTPGSDDFLSPAPSIPPRSSSTFTIFRQPQRSFVKPLELPGGVVIDLGNSGFGAFGREFMAPLNTSTGNPSPADTRIIISFLPTGAVDRVYYMRWDRSPPGSTNFDFVFEGVRPNADIHLLIADAGEMIPSPPQTAFPTIETSPSDNTQIPYNAAIADHENYWVTIGHITGDVTTTENAWALIPQGQPNYQESLAVAREFARSGQAKGGR